MWKEIATFCVHPSHLISFYLFIFQFQLAKLILNIDFTNPPIYFWLQSYISLNSPQQLKIHNHWQTLSLNPHIYIRLAHCLDQEPSFLWTSNFNFYPIPLWIPALLNPIPLAFSQVKSLRKLLSPVRKLESMGRCRETEQEQILGRQHLAHY